MLSFFVLARPKIFIFLCFLLLPSRFPATAVRTEEDGNNSKTLSLKNLLALKKRVPIEMLSPLVTNCNILYTFFIRILLISCGDIELNPGPILSFAEAKTICNADKKKAKIFQVNCRIIVNKRRALSAVVGELPENTIFCFTDTWLTSNDQDDFYNPKKDQYVCFRFDGAKEGILKKGGGVMLLIPKIFSPKLRKDLNKFSVDFESIWAELKINNRKIQNTTILLNVTYSPNKNKTDIFLEQLATNIDNAIVRGHKILLMGDYNSNYLNSKEKEKLDSILLPYHLELQNKTEATRICKASKTATLIDYFISDIYVKKTIVFDTPILSDHFALCTILKEGTYPLKLVEKKKVYVQST